MRTQSFDSSFAAFVESKLHCAAITPNTIVSKTEKAAWMAPKKGTASSDESTTIARAKERDPWFGVGNG